MGTHENPAVSGVDQVPATRRARRLSIAVASIGGQEVRANLLPIQTPTPREVSKLHDLYEEMVSRSRREEEDWVGCPGVCPVGEEMLIILGQGKMEKTFPNERDIRYAGLHFEYKPV